MRALVVVLLVGGCSKHEEHVPPPPPAPAPVVTKTNAADRLVDRSVCVKAERARWAGRWDGARPFDNANPLAHRGPTVVTITDKLHLSEGVGAAGYQVDLALDGDGVLARGESDHTSTHNAINMSGSAVGAITISEQAAVAACLDASGQLHLWRVLGASGDKIEATHEEDDVVLTFHPPPKPVPPPPGFHVLAEEDHPDQVVVTATDVVWSTVSGLPAVSKIRAMPRAGGAVRDLATGIPFVHRLAVHGDYIYLGGHESIGRIPLAGGPVETLVADQGAMDLAVDDKNLVWAGLDDVIRVRPLAGGTPKDIYTPKDAQIGGLVLDGGAIFVAIRPMSLDVVGSVVRVSPSGGASTLARITICGEHMIAAGGSIVLATCDGPILAVGEHGGSRKLTTDTEDVAAFAAAGNLIVFAVGAGRGVLGAVPLAGGKPRVVLQGEVDPEWLAIDPKDPKTVYVIDRGWNFDDPVGRIGTVAL